MVYPLILLEFLQLLVIHRCMVHTLTGRFEAFSDWLRTAIWKNQISALGDASWWAIRAPVYKNLSSILYPWHETSILNVFDLCYQLIVVPSKLDPETSHTLLDAQIITGLLLAQRLSVAFLIASCWALWQLLGAVCHVLWTWRKSWCACVRVTPIWMGTFRLLRMILVSLILCHSHVTNRV